MSKIVVEKNCIAEINLLTEQTHSAPFSEVKLYVHIQGEKASYRIPGFWRGDNRWSVRFSSPVCGVFQYETICNEDNQLNGVCGMIEVVPYTGNSILYQKGAVRCAADHNHFEYSDGSPFFWLADTWWNGMSDRMEFKKGFQQIVRDRKAKGFTVIQTGIGLLPIMDIFDIRAKNSSGFTWTEDLSAVNPAFFDDCDKKIFYCIEQGLSPCIFGNWGYNAQEFGIQRLKDHWEYLIARWAALPVIWCLAGEGDMPWFLSAHRLRDKLQQRKIWTEVGSYVKDTDPYHRLVTIHPTASSYSVTDPIYGDCLSTNVISERENILDFEMLQTGHFKSECISKTMEAVKEAVKRNRNRRPILNGEVCYEGMFDDSSASDQRFFMMANILSGANAGYTYGAAGIWEANTKECMAGVSPDGINWSTATWQEAMNYAGSRQVGNIKKLLERFDWWNIESHPEWLKEHWNGENYKKSFAGGVPERYRIFYFIAKSKPFGEIQKLENDILYEGYFYNPINGEETGRTQIIGKESYVVPMPSVMQDWIYVLERKY